MLNPYAHTKHRWWICMTHIVIHKDEYKKDAFDNEKEDLNLKPSSRLMAIKRYGNRYLIAWLPLDA